jgi:myo-inositol-1(or 4)-monophosphatase
VRATLIAGAPELPVFGEEEGGERAAVGWLVDPLDGTANFVHRFPVVGVSIALVAEQAPLVGVVHAPMLHETYWATAGGGAWRDGEALSVSDRSPSAAICATGFPFRAKRERLSEYVPVFERALTSFEDLRRAGSASLDLAWTAAGVYDGYFEQALGPWDVAAGALLVREAGGVVTDWHGDPDAWLQTGDVLAAPPAIHEHLRRIAGSHAESP